MDGQHTHTHGGSGDGAAMVVAAGTVVIGGVILMPIILAILQAIMVILITVAAMAVAGGAGYLIYRHKHPKPLGYTQTDWRELPRARQPKALPEAATHVTLTAEQYENLVRRMGQ
jgi:hypothetical protein